MREAGHDGAQVRLTRREGLLLLGISTPLAALAACSSDAAPAPRSTDTAPPSDISARDESGLIAEYEAVLAGFTDLPEATRALLQDLRQQHVQHRDALGGAPDAPGSTTAASLSAALGQLARLEREAARSRLVACVDATDPEGARLLALIGASEASHVAALKDLT